MLTNDTVRVLKLVDHDKQFEFNEHQAATQPIILNHADLSEPDYIDQLSQRIAADGAGADFIARCSCGETEGNEKIEMICPVCNTPVAPSHLLDDDHLICRNWLACPVELPNGWLAPKIYLNLAEWLSYDKGRRNYLDDILDVDTPIPYDLSDIVTGKGFGYLYDNFDRLMEHFALNHPVISKKPDTSAMRYCLAINRSRIFCHYIPVLNSALSPIVGDAGGASGKKHYTDVTGDHVIKAAISLSRLAHGPKKKDRHILVERVAFKAFKDLVAYTEEATKKYVSNKKAIPRTHIFGSRFHWSFRAVVVPITEPHDYYELHVPWRLAVNTLRVHLHGILQNKYGYSLNQAVAKVRHALQVVDEDILTILNFLIEDSPFPGIACVWDRPPSIRDGSVMLKYWTKIKTDIDDSTMGITPTDVALPNADFDGDNLAGIIILEAEMVNALKNISPSSLIYNRNTGEVSSEIGINKSLAITWNSFLQNV